MCQKILFFFILSIGTLFLRGQQYTKLSYHLEYKEKSKVLSGTLKITLTKEAEYVDDTLKLHLPSRSLEWKQSALHKQLLQYQKVDAHFAKARKLGYIKLNGALAQYDCVSCEFISIPLNEVSSIKDSINVELNFEIGLPEAQFNGIGYNRYDGVGIAEWLPKPIISAEEYPFRLENDVHPHKFDYNVQLTLPKELVVLSNLNLKTATELKWMHEKTIPSGVQPLPIEQLKTIDFKGVANDAQFFWSTNYLLSKLSDSTFIATEDQNAAWGAMMPLVRENMHAYLEKEGLQRPQPYSILLLQDKIGQYQNTGSLVILNMPKSPFEFETELMYALAEQKLRYGLSIDGYQEAWLARGLPYFYKYNYIQQRYPDKKWLPFSNSFLGRFFDLDEFENPYQNAFLYLYLARQNLDQPLNTRVDSLTRLNYDAIAEAKSFLLLYHLRAYVGERNFKRSMYRFIDRYNDTLSARQQLKMAFSYYHNQPVNAFFDVMPNSTAHYDFAITHTDYCPTVATATVINRGGLMLPYSLTGYKDGMPIHTEWFQPHVGKRQVQLIHDQYDYVVLNKHLTQPEYSQKNNRVRRKGVFRQMEPLRLQFYNSFERPDRTQVFWLPTANYNAYDKLLLGVTLSNNSLVQKKFEYSIGPEFSTGTSRLTGYASAVYNSTSAFKNSYLRQWRAGVYARYYHYDEDLSYFRLSPAVNFYFENPNAYRKIRSRLRLRGVNVTRELATDFNGEGNELENASYTVFNANYRLENISITKPYTIRADFQLANAFSRFDVETDHRFMLPNKKWLIWRNFGGVFLKTQNTEQGTIGYYEYGLSGTQDYLFDYSLIGRSDESGIWSRQFFTTDGGFKSETGVFANRFLLSSNLSIPIYSFFGVFGDVGFANNLNTTYWDYGIRLAFLTDFLEVYIPFANNQQNFLNQPAFLENTRFVLDINLGNIINRVRRGYY
jgi:hypothetical protein